LKKELHVVISKQTTNPAYVPYNKGWGFKPIRRADFEAVVRRICPVPVVEAAR
jgi:hypothetical protein